MLLQVAHSKLISETKNAKQFKILYFSYDVKYNNKVNSQKCFQNTVPVIFVYLSKYIS